MLVPADRPHQLECCRLLNSAPVSFTHLRQQAAFHGIHFRLLLAILGVQRRELLVRARAARQHALVELHVHAVQLAPRPLQQPLAAILFYICLLAEAGRAPFDLAEAEQELIAGWHTEYSSMKWALFFMGEYVHLVVGSAFFATLFMGGWSLNPFWGWDLPASGAWWMILTQPLALLFLILAFLGLFGSQIVKLIGTTKETITKIRERTHWNISNISAKHPAMLGLCKQADLDAAIEKAGGNPHVEEQVQDISELP